ncbi:hypothetical protein GCM10009865_46560 [Aeromicrobium ponti]|uniref:Transcriptional regulator with XRE-family HTH domain n=1 Tax=Cytobacillus oceanisediminis TaxID=665099 RepID=A0A562J4J3_9BACI|nr:helix-turn-helix transcriptional regulator [Cytobacillus oceanisediminis]TWH78099.1 transcriptional regulator with XRE-family HTH domain [Cytobacillus oceanisediminis]
MPALQIDSFDFKYLQNCTLGERLRFFRQKMMQYHPNKDYTVTSLGKRLRITPQSISAIERGDSKNPSFQVIHKLTKEYRVPLDSVTDEYYQDEGRLFTIGIPDVVDATDIELDDIETIKYNGNIIYENKSDDFFEGDSMMGLLLYQSNDNNIIDLIFHRYFKESISDDQLSDIVSRLIFETSSVSREKLDIDELPHPAVQAKHILEQKNQPLSLKELGELLYNPAAKEKRDKK